MCLEATRLWDESLSHIVTLPQVQVPLPSPRNGERPLEKDCANFGWRDAFALSPVIYVWHLDRVCSMTWHKYLHVKFFLAQVMPLTSVCLLSPVSHSLSSLFIALLFTQKKSHLFYFDFVHALSSCSPPQHRLLRHYHYQLLGATMATNKINDDAHRWLLLCFAFLCSCFIFLFHVFLRI